MYDLNETAAPPKPPVPHYRIPPPNYCLSSCDWIYSEAPLEGVAYARLCLDNDFCIGILLHYGTWTRTLGEFRFDKVISARILEPRWLQYSQERDRLNAKSRIRMHLGGSEDMKKSEEYSSRPMIGWCVWWYGKDKSDIAIL